MKTVLLTITASLAILPASAAMSEIRLQPHRAVYELSMAADSTSTGVSATTGAIFYEFTESCDGFTTNNRTILRTSYDEGPERTSDWTYSGWESHDGKDYRFNVHSSTNGQKGPDIRGAAELNDGGGSVDYRQPVTRTLSLAQGTIFPARHIERLIAAAQSGENFLLADVFDGFSVDTPYYSINAFIGPLSAPAADAKPGLKTDSWKMRLAFFDKTTRSEQPSYELGVRYFANGIATEVVQDFGDLKIDGKLREIELLPHPKC